MSLELLKELQTDDEPYTIKVYRDRITNKIEYMINNKDSLNGSQLLELIFNKYTFDKKSHQFIRLVRKYSPQDLDTHMFYNTVRSKLPGKICAQAIKKNPNSFKYLSDMQKDYIRQYI